MKVKSANPNAMKDLQVNLDKLEGVEGKVGWFETSKYADGTPVAYVAQLNNEGHGNTPARPFFSTAQKENKAKWSDVAEEVSRLVLQGKISSIDAMGILTLQAQGDVTKTIVKLTDPALSPVTIELRAMKKRNPNLIVTAATVGEAARRVSMPGYVTPDVSIQPLDDTGHMIATLTSVVDKV